MKSITKTFLKTKKKYEILELLVTNFARTHSELPKQPIVQWWNLEVSLARLQQSAELVTLL